MFLLPAQKTFLMGGTISFLFLPHLEPPSLLALLSLRHQAGVRLFKEGASDSRCTHLSNDGVGRSFATSTRESFCK